MSLSVFIITALLLFVSDCKGAISDQRLCGDPTCSEPVSLGLTLIRYVSDDARILSFQGNVKVTVFSKSAGSRPDLWGVEINGIRGYAPKSFIKEQKILQGKLDHILSTSDTTTDTIADSPTLLQSVDEGIVPVPDIKGNIPSIPNVDASTKEMEKSVSSSETLEPYEVVDGTTFLFSTDSPTEPSPIQATITESNIQPSSIQFQPEVEPKMATLDEPTPNPSLALPNAATSADANGDKQDAEGSAEKIYNYLMSNFISEQDSGELGSVEKDKYIEKENFPPGVSSNMVEEVLTKSTASTSDSLVGTGIQSDTIENQGDGSISPSSTDINMSAAAGKVDGPLTPEIDDIINKSTLNEAPKLKYMDPPSSDSSVKKEGSGNKDGSLLHDDSEEMIIERLNESSEEDDDDEYEDDDEEEEDEDGEEEDVDISGEEYNSSEEKASNDPGKITQHNLEVAVPTDSTPSNTPELVEGLSKVVNGTSIEHVTTTITEGTNVANGSISGSNTPETEVGPSQAEDAVNNPDAQVVGPPSLEANIPNPEQINDLKPFEVHAKTDSNVDNIVQESTVDQRATHIPSNVNLDQHNDSPMTTSTASLEQNFGNMAIAISEDKDVVLDKNTLNPDDIANEISSSDLTFDVPSTESDLENKGRVIAESSLDKSNPYEINDTNPNENNETASVEPELESTLNATSQESSIPVTEGFNSVYDTNESTPVTMSPTDESTKDLYDNFDEDSPLNVVTEAPVTYPEPNLDSISENDVESSEGFFSGMVSSLFQNYFSYSETSSPTEIEVVESAEQENAKELDDGKKENEDLNLAQQILLTHGKQPDMPETLSTCSAKPGNNPSCDNDLFTGNEPSVSDDEAVLPQTMEEQERVPFMDMWEFEGAYGMMSYLTITAISMAVIILGHWFIEKSKCDSTFIKRINDLERALLYAELESQNLKADLEETRGKVLSGSEEVESMKALEEQLQTALESAVSLEEKNASLEEKNAGLQVSLDAATEAGLELNLMLSDILATNKGSESLILSVNDLQHQLNSQQTTINNMNSVLSSKEAESEGLKNQLSTAQNTILSLERELNQVTESLQELLKEKCTREDHLKSMKINLESQIKAKSTRIEELTKEAESLRFNIQEMHSKQLASNIEMSLLKDCMTALREGTNANEEEFQVVFDVAKIKAACLEVTAERNRLADELEGEKDARKLLTDHVEVTTKEVEMLRKAVEQSEKEKQEALTKHAVLADYFKDKESQLQKELGYKDAMYMQTKGDATSTHEEVKTLHEQLESYKSQIVTLKSEIVDQERGLRTQILTFEKKAHENWLAARQAERKLQESKLEASQLRNRLTVVEKNASNTVNSEVTTGDRDSMDLNCMSPSSSPLYSLDSNNISGDNGASSAARLQLMPPPPGQMNHPLDEASFHLGRSNASPSLNSRSQPVLKSPNNLGIMFRVEEAHDPHSPFYGILSPSAPYDPFHGRPVQDRHDPDLYHIIPLLPYMSGPPPLILPPPVLPNVPGTRDRRPPPLGRMSSPPVGGHMSPQPPRGHKSSPPHGRGTSPYNNLTLEQRRIRCSPMCDRIVFPPPSPSIEHSVSPDRGRRRSLQRGRQSPIRRLSPDCTSTDSTSEGPLSPLPSPNRARFYRLRSRSPSPYSSAGSTPENQRQLTRRFNLSPDGSYLGRSRTPSPAGFRPISRHANQGSNHSEESNRRSGRP